MNAMRRRCLVAPTGLSVLRSFIVYMPCLEFLLPYVKGRTVRQFVLLNILVPSIFCIVWIGVFGGQAMYLQTSGMMDICDSVNTLGMQTTIFYILSSLPMGKILCVLFLVTIAISFSTLADPCLPFWPSWCVLTCRKWIA